VIAVVVLIKITSESVCYVCHNSHARKEDERWLTERHTNSGQRHPQNKVNANVSAWWWNLRALFKIVSISFMSCPCCPGGCDASHYFNFFFCFGFVKSKMISANHELVIWVASEIYHFYMDCNWDKYIRPLDCFVIHASRKLQYGFWKWDLMMSSG
jgi:hypothetical protein